MLIGFELSTKHYLKKTILNNLKFDRI